MKPRAVCHQLAFLAQRMLDAYERGHPTGAGRARCKALRRSGARVQYWLLTYARLPSEWSSSHLLTESSENHGSKLLEDQPVSLHAWLYDRLRDEESLSHSLTRFTLHFLRERLNEDLRFYVDRSGRSVAPGALVFFEEEAWTVASASKHEFLLKRTGEARRVPEDDLARRGTKLSDVGADAVPLDALRGDEDLLSGYYLNGRRMRSEAERMYAATQRASAAADARPQPERGPELSGGDVQAHVSAAVNLLMAKRAAKSNLTTTGSKRRSRFAVLRR